MAKYILEVEMDSDETPTVEQAEIAAKVVATHLPGSFVDWRVMHDFVTYNKQ